MIGVDWGTTNLRAWRFAPDGAVLERRAAAQGVMVVPAGGFAAAFDAIAGDWVAAGERDVLLGGMVGSRQGWREVPYVACPTGIAEIAAGAQPVAIPGARALILPGLCWRGADGVTEVMRGEEVELAALIALRGAAEATLCSPGSHSKWARIAGGAVTGFATYLTGEAHAALSRHTILRHSIAEGAPAEGTPGGVPAGFAEGVAQAKRAGGLLHHLFGLRTRTLMGELPVSAGAGFLSGLLIGHEVAAALEAGVAPPVVLTGAESLRLLYAAALDGYGVPHARSEAVSAAAGLVVLGRALGLLASG